jgi:hypothetical protein
MTDRILPALSAAAWREVREYLASNSPIPLGEYLQAIVDDQQETARWSLENTAAGMIAALNDALPDSDPRKITRETVRYLRELANFLESVSEERTGIAEPEMQLRAIADALESYLPPER